MVSSLGSGIYRIVDDQKYAVEVQLHETLVSLTTSQINESISSLSPSSQKDASSTDTPSSQTDESSSLSQTDASSSQTDDVTSPLSQTDASSSQEDEPSIDAPSSSSSSQRDESSTDASSSSSSQEDELSTDAPSSSSQKDESISQTDTSPSSQTDTSSSSSIPATSTPPNRLKRKKPMVASEEEDEEEAKVPKSFCGICMDTKSPSEMFSNATVCNHLFCSDCIRGHVSTKIKENIPLVKCPDPKCKGVIGPEHCRSIVPKEVLERWQDVLCESLILGTQKFYCPFKDCSAMLVDDGGEVVTSSECPNCNRLFCAQCKVPWHSGMDCREFKRLKKDEGNREDIMLMNLAKKKKWRRCPSCKFYVEKRDGCNHISCRCGYEFCYRCGKEYDTTHVCNP